MSKLPVIVREWREIWSRFADRAMRVHYPRGRVLVSQGQHAAAIMSVESGIVALRHRVDATREIVVALRDRGWPLGSVAALADVASPVTIVSLTDCEVSAIDRHAFVTRVTAEDHLLKAVVRLHSLEVHEHLTRLAFLTCTPARLRLESTLAWLGQRVGPPALAGGIRVRLPLTHEDLANAIQVRRETLTRMLGDLECDHMIERRAGALFLSPSFLRSLDQDTLATPGDVNHSGV